MIAFRVSAALKRQEQRQNFFRVSHVLSCLCLLSSQWRFKTSPTSTPVPEIIDPVFAKTCPKRSFCMTEDERFGLVFVKTGSINSGTGGRLKTLAASVTGRAAATTADSAPTGISTTSTTTSPTGTTRQQLTVDPTGILPPFPPTRETSVPCATRLPAATGVAAAAAAASITSRVI